MKRLIYVAFLLLAFSAIANAIPSLQVHAVDSVAYDTNIDKNTWLSSDPNASNVNLELIGTLDDGSGTNTISSISNAYLVMTMQAHDGSPWPLGYWGLFQKYDSLVGFLDLLSDPSLTSFSGFDHNPSGLDESFVDVYTLDLSAFGIFSSQSEFGSFTARTETKDCNADIAGNTSCGNAIGSSGEIQNLYLDIYDFYTFTDWVHFDLLALVEDSTGNKQWQMTSDSYDSTWYNPLVYVPENNPVPAPGANILMVTGILLLSRFRVKHG